MAKVLVTGGAGFIGSHVVDRLVTEGFDVRVIDDLSNGRLENIQGHLNSGKVEFVKGNICDPAFVTKSLKDVSSVAHFAALISVPLSIKNPKTTFDINLGGTLNLLRASSKTRIDKFVFISSCAVCGDPQSLPVTEETPANPISPYAESKLLGERYCLGFGERGLLNPIILRFFNVYGPRQGINDYSGVITRFIEMARKKLPLTIYGDGLQTRDFVNVDDIAQGVSAAIKTSIANEVFNIGSGKPTTINELAQTILSLVGVDATIQYLAARSGDIRDSYADVSKAGRLLGYKSQVSLKKGLKTLIDTERVSI